MIDPVRVAALQFSPVQFEHQENLARLEAMTVEAARGGAKLIVHPEMATTGYCWYDRTEIEPFVETIPGPTTDRFGRTGWSASGKSEAKNGPPSIPRPLSSISDPPDSSKS